MTVREILNQEGIDPAPDRASTTWAAFLRPQADALPAIDFIETVTLTGQHQYILAAIEHATRRIRILGSVWTGFSSGAAFALAALRAVGWMTWRGSDATRRRDDGRPSAGMRKAYKAVTGNTTTQEEQEEKLREALHTCPADRRGYIKAQPEAYPDLTQRRAARIAWEMGLRAVRRAAEAHGASRRP
ncbi:hypothetical protein ABZ642_00175 [Streptomyces sp. NPDC007157]|uniref:hypothetical protein n=1 Tax=Streptomyces sp. NPDC007157 TaxID=3154681 RepID=UPI0033F06726